MYQNLRHNQYRHPFLVTNKTKMITRNNRIFFIYYLKFIFFKKFKRNSKKNGYKNFFLPDQVNTSHKSDIEGPRINSGYRSYIPRLDEGYHPVI